MVLAKLISPRVRMYETRTMSVKVVVVWWEKKVLHFHSSPRIIMFNSILVRISPFNALGLVGGDSPLKIRFIPETTILSQLSMRFFCQIQLN